MNPLELIQQYTSNILKSAVMLKHLGYDSFPLPSMEEVIKIKNELLSIHPSDITAQSCISSLRRKQSASSGSRLSLAVKRFHAFDMAELWVEENESDEVSNSPIPHGVL